MIIPGFIKTPILLNQVSAGTTASNLDVIRNGMPADACARAILAAVALNRAEAYIGGNEIYTLYIHRLFPGILRWLIRNHHVRHLQKWTRFHLRLLGGRRPVEQQAPV